MAEATELEHAPSSSSGLVKPVFISCQAWCWFSRNAPDFVEMKSASPPPPPAKEVANPGGREVAVLSTLALWGGRSGGLEGGGRFSVPDFEESPLDPGAGTFLRGAPPEGCTI